MRENFWKKTSIIITIMLLFGASFTTIISGNENNSRSYKSGNLTIFYHLATQDDIEEMKIIDGVYNPNDNYNAGLLPPTEDDYEKMKGTLKIIDDVQSQERLDLPDEYLMEDEKYLPPVKSQSPYWSCVSWAITYYTNGYIQARDNGWDAKEGGSRYRLSPFFTYNFLNGGDGYVGTTYGSTIDILQKIGVCTYYNMSSSSPTQWGSEAAWRDAPQYRVGQDSIISLYGLDNDDILAMKTLLNESHKPLPFGINAASINYVQPPNNWVYGSTELSGYSDHAVTIVGYDDNVYDPESDKTGAFRVVNSWGNHKHDGGFFWVTYDAFLQGNGLGSIYHFNDFYTIGDYPRLIGTWEFDEIPTRNHDTLVSLLHRNQPELDPIDTKDGKWKYNTTYELSSFMCLDLTYPEFYEVWESGQDPELYNFSLYVRTRSSGGHEGTVKSFTIEYYEDEYTPGKPTQKSRKTCPSDLENNPRETPCTVWVKDFNYSLVPVINLGGTFEGLEGGRLYSYTLSATDLEPPLYYYLDFGDGSNTGWLGPFDSGEELQWDYGWEYEDTYTMIAIVEDRGGFRNIVEKSIEVMDDNSPPLKPDTPEIVKVPGEEDTYDCIGVTQDPEENNIYYMWRWRKVAGGNSGSTSWRGPYDSNKPDTYRHTFSGKGLWEVNVTGKDIWNAVGPTSNYAYKFCNYASGCPHGTQVHMAAGSIPLVRNIENIVVGNLISSYNTVTQQVVTARVTAVHSYNLDLPNSILDINYNFNEYTKTTPNHLILTNRTEWVKASTVEREDIILKNIPGTIFTFWIPIDSVDEVPLFPGVTIYDLEVKPVFSDYASGYFADGILVGGFI